MSEFEYVLVLASGLKPGDLFFDSESLANVRNTNLKFQLTVSIDNRPESLFASTITSMWEGRLVVEQYPFDMMIFKVGQ